jgi:anti-sigma B factor antagonist
VAFFLHEPRGDPPVIRADGELDMAAAPDLRGMLAQLIVERTKRVVVDLSEATFIDSTTIGALVAAHHRVRRYGGVLELVCTNPNVLRTFEFAGLRRELVIHESLDEILHPAGRSA